MFNVINKLPSFKTKKSLKILEPSVGIGNFLPLLFKKYKDIQDVILDVIDIDKDSLDTLKVLLSKTKIPKNFTINFIHSDFLLWESNITYDLIIGNPPYGKIVNNKNLLNKYKLNIKNTNTNNLFSFFIEKTIKLSKYVALIVPKSLINAPEFNQTRDLLENVNLHSLTDYGEKAFKGVKIETISFYLILIKKNKLKKIKIRKLYYK